MTRPSVHEYLLNLAAVAATRSTCSRLQVGAVIAQDGHLISTGYNGAPSGLSHCRHEPGDDSPCRISVHAEANAINQAARYGMKVGGGALYLTHAPCLGCSGHILNSGIRHVFYRDTYRSDDGVHRLKLGGLDVRHLPTDQPNDDAGSWLPWRWRS